MDKTSFELQAMQLAQHYAQSSLRMNPHQDHDCVADAVSLAWEAAQSPAPAATPSSIAWYAFKRSLQARQFRENAMSLLGPNPRRIIKPMRDEIDANDIIDYKGDPAEIACFWLTFVPWFRGLPSRNRRIAAALVMGHRTGEVARRFHVSAARISEIRRELKEEWERITA